MSCSAAIASDWFYLLGTSNFDQAASEEEFVGEVDTVPKLILFDWTIYIYTHIYIYIYTIMFNL